MYLTGAGFTVSVGGQQLQCTVQIPSSSSSSSGYKGLYGNVNGDPTDDLIPSNGTQLSASATESDIFFLFGQTCKLLRVM